MKTGTFKEREQKHWLDWGKAWAEDKATLKMSKKNSAKIC